MQVVGCAGIQKHVVKIRNKSTTHAAGHSWLLCLMAPPLHKGYTVTKK